MNVSPNGGGTIKVKHLVSSSYPATYNFSNGTKVHLEAVPASGYRFNNWSGDLPGTTNPTTIVINCNKSITASFSQIMYTLTVEVSGSGSTTPTGGAHEYSEGTVVSITATPDIGWQFDSWTGNVIVPNPATATLTMDSDKTITAKFSPDWSLVGGLISGVVLAGLLVTVLIVRRRA